MTDPDLAHTLRLAERVLPALHGRQTHRPLRDEAAPDGEAGTIRFGGDNRAQWAALRDFWTRAHPEAGRHYSALRCWGLLIWQPIYLCVIAAQLGRHCPRLAGICQPLRDGCPAGFALPAHAPAAGGEAARQACAVGEIRALCACFRDELSRATRLASRAADCLQADCVLSALLTVQRHDAMLPNAHLIALGDAWLGALGLAGASGYFPFRTADGDIRLALDRRACCHHFRRRDGEPCDTCPKLAPPVRIARLQAQAAGT